MRETPFACVRVGSDALFFFFNHPTPGVGFGFGFARARIRSIIHPSHPSIHPSVVSSTVSFRED